MADRDAEEEVCAGGLTRDIAAFARFNRIDERDYEKLQALVTRE